MPHIVRIDHSGHQFIVNDGETVLEAALRQDIVLPYGCRNGACGSCMGTLLTGQVHYDDARIPALTDDDQSQNRALFCQARPVTDLTIEVREIDTTGDIEVKTLPCRVAHLNAIAHDVMEIKLKLPAAERLQFLAGQYIEILLKDNRRRGFSIANAPHDDDFIVLQVRQVEGGYFSEFVFNQMQEKALLRLEGPLGTFYLRENSSRPIILIGGGTGFAPLKGMIEHAFFTGMTRPMHLFWGVRAKQDLYSDLPEQWEHDHANFTYTPVLSEPLPEDNWAGETGLVTDSVVRHYPDLNDHEIYVSGPPVMIEAGKNLFFNHGMQQEHMYSDAFEFAPRTDSPSQD